MKRLELRRCSRGIVINKDKILLGSKEYTETGNVTYRVPGGGLEGKETHEKALYTETLEELGVEITNIRPLGIVKRYNRPYKDFKKSIIYSSVEETWFIADYLQDNLSLYGIEGDGMDRLWVGIDEAINLVAKSISYHNKREVLKALSMIKEKKLLC